MRRLPGAAAAERALEPKLRAHGVLWDGPAGGSFELYLVAETYALYHVARRRARRDPGPAGRRLLEEAERARIQCRELGARFFDLLPPCRAGLAVLDARGEDAELQRWFTPGAPITLAGRRQPRREHA